MSAPTIDFESIVNQANDVILVMALEPGDTGARIVYANEAFTRIMGYARDEVIGQSPRMLSGPDTAAETVREISAAIHRGEAIRRRILNYGKDGRAHWLEISVVPLPGGDGRTAHFAAIEREVTAEIENERKLELLAATDPLTGLGNRRFFDEVMEREIARARRQATPLSVVAYDLDHFKRVNDSHGHEIGDDVLVAFARILNTATRGHDCVARVGGEEFCVLLTGAKPADALRVAERIREQTAAKPLAFAGGKPVNVTCSGGIAILGDGDANAGDLLRRADRALYRAKRTGRNRICDDAHDPTLAAAS